MYIQNMFSERFGQQGYNNNANYGLQEYYSCDAFKLLVSRIF